jgi:HTH-type transcriptional regulator/antitoxin HigA
MTDKKVAEAFPPGEFIKEELEARNWSQIELAEIIGRLPKVVNDLVLGKRPISPDIAKALGDAFGTSAQYWMNLESSYQLWRAKDVDNAVARRARLYGKAPIKDMVKRHWIEPSENVEVLEKRVMKFFEINSLDEPFQMPHAAQKGIEEMTPPQWTWVYRAKHLASCLHAHSFSNKSFKEGLNQLRKLLPNAQEIRHVPKILAEAGIRFLIVEHLPHTKIDGVALWLDNKSPAIVLSLRYDRIDYFWHTLAHELGHIEKRDGLDAIMLDSDLVGDESEPLEQKTEAEKQANAFAVEFLIKQADLDDFITRAAPLYGKKKILDFALHNKVHPGLVVGQLQFRREIAWGSYRQMLEKIRHIIIPAALTDGWGQTAPTLTTAA